MIKPINHWTRHMCSGLTSPEIWGGQNV